MKKFLLVLFSAFVLVSFTACAKEAARKMSLELKQVKIRNFSNSGFTAVAYMQVTNPNWFSIDVSDMKYAVLVNNHQVADGRLEKEVSIPADSSATAELPLNVGADGLNNLLGEILDVKEGLTYRVKGEVVFKTLLGSYTMPFDAEKKTGKKKK